MVPGFPTGPEGGELFAAGGEAGRLMAALDWAATPVGPVTTWPASLRFAVRTVLVSRFPMVLTWGPEFTQFYNDAYAPLSARSTPRSATTSGRRWPPAGGCWAHRSRTR